MAADQPEIRSDDVAELSGTDHPAASAESPPKGGDKESEGLSFPLPQPLVGKRPVDDDAAEDEGTLDDVDEPPRKRARNGSATDEVAPTEPSSSGDDGQSDSEGAGNTPDSNSSGQQDSTPSSGEPSVSAAPASAAPGLRTSFGKAPPDQLKNARGGDMAKHNPVTADERKQLFAAIQAREAKAVPPMTKRGLDWPVSPLKTDWLIGVTWLEIFESTLDKWCEAFTAENQENIDEVGLAPSFLKKSFFRALQEDITPKLPRIISQTAKQNLSRPETSRLRNFASVFKPDPEKLEQKAATVPVNADERKQTRAEKRAERRAEKRAAKKLKAAESATPQTQKQAPGTSTHESAPNNNPIDSTNAKTKFEVEGSDHAFDEEQHDEGEMEDGEIESDADAADDVEMEIDEDKPQPSLSEAELYQRHRYFPGLPDDATFCLICAQYDHTDASCLEVTCKYCQGDHFRYECPTRQRCAKCRQIGHPKTSCPEKLAVAPDEAALECAVCGLHDHKETNCSELWQTYHPRPGKVKKVKSLPIFCYCCGNVGHYGGDCGLAGPDIPPTKTWTISTASLYIDAATNEEALVYKNTLPPPPDVSRPVIPGRSIKPQSHIIFEESDDSVDADGRGFLHAPGAGPSAKQKKQRGTAGKQIQIKSNISFGGPASAPAPASGLGSSQQRIPPSNTSGVDGPSGTRSSEPRYPQRQRNQWPQTGNRSPPPPVRGGKNYPLRSGKAVPKAGQGQRFPKQQQEQQQQQQQPPLPPGPPPPYSSAAQQGSGGGRGGGRSGGSAGRGRGGFSNLSRRQRKKRG